MSFMQKQIVQGSWLEIETMNGTVFLPEDIAPQTAIDFCDLIGELHEPDELPATVKCDLLEFTEVHDANHIESVERITGFGCRLSAPGYMDCTDWTVHKTEKEAEQYLSEMYDD